MPEIPTNPDTRPQNSDMMEDKEIFELVDKKVLESSQHLERQMEVQYKSLTLFIADENQQIRKSISDLGTKIEKQNGAVRDLQNWRSEMRGIQKQKSRGFVNVMKIVMALIAAAGLLFTVYTKMNKTEKAVEDLVNNSVIIKNQENGISGNIQ